MVEHASSDERGGDDVRRDRERPEGRAKMDDRCEAEDGVWFGCFDEEAYACGFTSDKQVSIFSPYFLQCMMRWEVTDR